MLNGHQLRTLYNAMVLPHLQYCLMVWGDFREGRNSGLGQALLKHQKRLMGLIAGKTGWYHADPIFAAQGILKIEDLYRQQLRIYAWQFWNKRLPENQAALLNRVGEMHQYGTRSAKKGLFMSTRDHRSVGYRVPKEWASLPQKLQNKGSIGGFKKSSSKELLEQYKSFTCSDRLCQVCTGTDRERATVTTREGERDYGE